MKRTLKSFFVSALMVLVCLTLVACSGDDGLNTEFKAPFGNKYPEQIKNSIKINATMDALQMYEVGVRNFNNLDFVATQQIGNISSKTALGTMNQKLDSLKIKQDNKYYLNSYTYTVSGAPKTNICDQSIYENGEYRVLSADKDNIKVNNNEVIVSKWPEKPEKFSSLDSGLEKYPNDPTRINMYIINSNTVTSSTKPTYDAKNKTYKFNLTLDTNKATTDYVKNMYYNTKKGGVNAKSINFTKLKLTIEMWDNGLIKSIANEEAYKVDTGMLGSLGVSNTTLLATTYFTYDRAEINISKYAKF